MERGESVTQGLHGMFRDVLRDERGRVVWERPWVKNVIVTDCRRLLAGFLRGAPTVPLSIQGLQVGAGLASWDATAPPAPNPTQASLVDPSRSPSAVRAPAGLPRRRSGLAHADEPASGPGYARARPAPVAGRKPCRHHAPRVRPRRLARRRDRS